VNPPHARGRNADTHAITKEIDMSQLPPARPGWEDMLISAVRTLRSSGDVTARGALFLLERLGLAEEKGTT
jgi:hypothetical protein